MTRPTAIRGKGILGKISSVWEIEKTARGGLRIDGPASSAKLHAHVSLAQTFPVVLYHFIHMYHLSLFFRIDCLMLSSTLFVAYRTISPFMG